MVVWSDLKYIYLLCENIMLPAEKTLQEGLESLDEHLPDFLSEYSKIEGI